MFIESLTNKRVKEWGKLKEKKYRDEQGLFLIEGDHLIQEAKKMGIVKEVISTNKNEHADYYVTKEIMKKISSQVSPSNSIAICYKLEEKAINGNLLILDNIQDPGNLGTIIRSAVAFNFDTIVLSNDSVDLYNEKVIRASEGMIFNINIIRRHILPFLKEINPNYTILVTDVKKGKNIKDIVSNKKMALVVGNEGNGVQEETKKYATEFVKISMNSSCESLNVGVAASILMYEIQGDNRE